MEKESTASPQSSSAQKMRPLLGSLSSTETRYLLPSRRKWPEATSNGQRRHIEHLLGQPSYGRLAAYRKSRASGNEADASQIGKTKDNVARDAVGVCNAFCCRCHERHHQERRLARAHRLLAGRSVEMGHVDQTHSGRFGN